jgi:N-acetyl-anhydromuramoyl-L-alanine amidase
MYAVNEQGWLEGVEHCSSPNFNERPDDIAVDLLVIHSISLPAGCFGTPHVRELFCNTLDCSIDPTFSSLQGLQVSAHLFIDREGRTTQFVSLNKRAWHAGISCFEGRENCNDFSIGIELEGDEQTPYTALQYQELQLVTRSVQCYYPAISSGRIVGHSDVAPGRKTDPGPAFDWAYYKKVVN